MITLALAQLDFVVGDIDGNLDKCRQAIAEAKNAGADLLLFPELALTGYPPEDLLLRPGFLEQARDALDTLLPEIQDIDVVLGHPWVENGSCYNTASWLRNGEVVGRYFKQHLPNYAVFDEQRYFKSGTRPMVVECKGVRVGVIICEDSWVPGPSSQSRDAGAEILLVPNASPYRDNKYAARLEMFERCTAEAGLPVVYCNLVGGQDELVFDGRSMLVNGSGEIAATGPLCEDLVLKADFNPASGCFDTPDWSGPPAEPMQEIYTVLVRGLRDYVTKNGFSDVVFGLSGGIDSALTLALAVDALGPDRVHTIMMPFRHTSDLSLDLASEQAERLNVDHRCIPIEPVFSALESALAESFTGREPDITEENLQARIRGDIVMSLSNKFGWLPLATSNKSELAVGYCTIYGDMCGGFAPLLDCSKMRVYALARYRNSLAPVHAPVIPSAVIERPPSAELRPDQSDQDSLPPYDVLDEILMRYVEKDWSVDEIIADGFDGETVRRVARLVLINEYKRRQAAPGVRVTHRAFGRDRRYPITSGWRDKGAA